MFLKMKKNAVIQWTLRFRRVIGNYCERNEMCLGIPKDGKFTKDFG